MNMLKIYKCVCCLIKCSKVLYFIKKAVCIATVLLVSGAAFMSLCSKEGNKKTIKKFKAVM